MDILKRLEAIQKKVNSLNESVDPSEKKKFETTLKVFLDKKLHKDNYTLKSQGDHWMLSLGDIQADDGAVEKFLDSLTEFFYGLKQKKTYKTIAPNWEQESEGEYRIFGDPAFDESGFYQESTQGKHPPLVEEEDEESSESEEKFASRLTNEHMERFVDGLLTILGELELEGQVPSIDSPQQARDALLAVVRQLFTKKSLVAKMSRKFARFGAKRFLRKQKTVIGKAVSQ